MNFSFTVTPGKQFAPGEKVTRAKLNQLGQPTISSEQVSNIAPTVSGQPAVWDATTNTWRPADTSSFQVGRQYLQVMLGATAIADGASGAVPKPLAGQQGLFLRGDATWGAPAGQTTADLFAAYNLY